ncbi:hypothetical protein EI42_00489 [Thermosporothrix hazakensis]|uniref:Uncharacterized protein n=2 Tax=Thermosporothrix TaxID=768650 RepID=A0A326UEH1_THEHA|nr:hypothetical protein EI42_00489 [Thermosporothrix hazakensis]BBH88782.1 hypothetical protein KTC_35330 [Thermosporothrix sp. COM3]GCE46965.1 hypothetical protein KTH_18340 [Thermosporothrix hazakensis]
MLFSTDMEQEQVVLIWYRKDEAFSLACCYVLLVSWVQNGSKEMEQICGARLERAQEVL